MHRFVRLTAILILTAGTWSSSEALLMKKMIKGAMMMGAMMRHDMPDWPTPLPMMTPEWQHAHDAGMDINPMMLTNAIPSSNGKMPSAEMADHWHQMPSLSMMSMKPAMGDDDTMAMVKMMAKMTNGGAKMAADVADQKMQMHMIMDAHGKPAPILKVVEAAPKLPCKVDPMSVPTMTATPNGVTMMARPAMAVRPDMMVRPEMMIRPEMMVRPEMMSEPLMVMPPPQMVQPMQQPMAMMTMMRTQNNAFPANVRAGSPMDRRA